jgi:hypothetical protein
MERALAAPSSLERLLHVAAFVVSPYSSQPLRENKPFNPLLGETFEWSDGSHRRAPRRRPPTLAPPAWLTLSRRRQARLWPALQPAAALLPSALAPAPAHLQPRSRYAGISAPTPPSFMNVCWGREGQPSRCAPAAPASAPLWYITRACQQPPTPPTPYPLDPPTQVPHRAGQPPPARQRNLR